MKGNTRGAQILVGAVASLVLLEGANRRGAEVHKVGVGLTAIVWAGVVLLCTVVGGGLSAPAIILLPAVPAVAAFASGRRAAMAWTIVSILTVVAMYGLAPLIPPTVLAPPALPNMRLLGGLLSLMLVGATVLSYDTKNRQQQEALEFARKEAEDARKRAEQATRAKSAFLATMSHEIRTPLTAVVGVAEVLQHTATDPQQAHQLSLVDSAGRTLLGLVDNVLDLSRIESGQLELEWIPVDLGEIVHDVGQVLQVRAQPKRIELTAAHTGPSWVVGDPLRLRQVLLNLVGNAVKFTDTGKVALRCEVSPGPAPDRYRVRLTVSDTGVGISAEQQETIFEPFVQADQGTARRFGGSGLGLSIVTQLVKAMDGKLSLDSEPGRGTTVTVDLLLAPGPKVEAKPEATPAVPKRSLRLLLVEDNPINQQVVRLMLAQWDCEVEVASDGFEAVRMVLEESHRFDLVLMDCQMPGMDGMEATRRIRAGGSTVPIVALTANATPSDRAMCLAAGMDDFTTKPIRLDALQSVLVRHGGPA